ncbi:hypothetical protein [Paractinoplanes brasiliensis]|uniref:Uncharacterized protein n=1 Tax=Paractinoplanes brasiliensis TaxID=52695 RepID=A0A4R6JN93_9ACTN|nr:hypothetical protein [Actinoplanes brasiliensis]TDO37222.1 hypothetical protein C8E87_0830 [Actinoplanes brasiliensis]GID32860.1 hypothetical protein Abr02nite_78430 [Actinoplanes brasiliensis]
MTALRWYAGIALVLFGIVPTVMVALLVNGGRTPSSVGYLLLVGIPLVGAAAVFAVRGFLERDPEQAARRLHLSMALVAGADLILLGGNALLRMNA